MGDKAEEVLSEKTLSGEESDSNQHVDEDNEDKFIQPINEDEGEWDTVSQISVETSEIITSTFSSGKNSSVWIYFDKNPAHTPGYNVCKICSKKYKSTTSVTVLRKHLESHKLKAPKKSEKSEKVQDPFNKREQEEHDEYLIQWLIQDLQPFTVVDNPSFRDFINFLCSRYVIPNRYRAKGKIFFFLYNI
jgi:hypothetical protein